jgi:hypothetical protein
VSGVERGQGVDLARSVGTNGGAAGIPVHHLWSELPVSRDGERPTHRAFPTDEASLAKLNERLVDVVYEFVGYSDGAMKCADAVMRVLFEDAP